MSDKSIADQFLRDGLTISELIKLHNDVDVYTDEHKDQLATSVNRLGENGLMTLEAMGLTQDDQKTLSTILLETLTPGAESPALDELVDKDPSLVGSLIYSTMTVVAGICAEMIDTKFKEMVNDAALLQSSRGKTL